jgi:hypothetical protein
MEFAQDGSLLCTGRIAVGGARGGIAHSLSQSTRPVNRQDTLRDSRDDRESRTVFALNLHHARRSETHAADPASYKMETDTYVYQSTQSAVREVDQTAPAIKSARGSHRMGFTFAS